VNTSIFCITWFQLLETINKVLQANKIGGKTALNHPIYSQA